MKTGPYKALAALHEDMRRDFPGFAIREKRVWYWWVLYFVGLMFLWNKGFMKTMWTTVGRVVYIPNAPSLFAAGRRDEEVMGSYATLWHERQHILDRTELEGVPEPLRGVVWFGGYFFPQFLALGALGAFWTPWAWCCLVFLAPWPAPFRVWAERRGYLASAEAWQYLTNGGWEPNVHDPWIQRIITRNFLGWSYWRMSWSRESVERWFAAGLEDLKMEFRRKS